MPESRLRRRSLKQSKRQLYIYLAAIVAIIFIGLNFGPLLIGTLGDTIDKITGKTNQSQTVSLKDDLNPPNFDPQPAATPSANITLTGNSDYPDVAVELFVNGSRRDRINVDSDQTFKFEDVELSSGVNFIKARIILGDKKSSFSDEITISRATDVPKLEVQGPANGQQFKGGDRQITVRGITDPDNGITVNGFIAIVDSSGNFSYNLNLNDGENKLNVIATNPAGQSTTTEITVSYSP